MGFLEIALQVLPFINTLMKIAEGLFGKSQGAAKKELVTAGAKTFIHNMQGVSTGGQLETWNRIEPHLSDVVDSTAAMLFPHVSSEADDAFND